MKYLLVRIITLYQRALSPDKGAIPRVLGLSGKTCIYYPSCSEYTKIAIVRHGSVKGVYLGVRRILRCTPFHSPKVDLVPEKL